MKNFQKSGARMKKKIWFMKKNKVEFIKNFNRFMKKNRSNPWISKLHEKKTSIMKNFHEKKQAIHKNFNSLIWPLSQRNRFIYKILRILDRSSAGDKSEVIAKELTTYYGGDSATKVSIAKHLYIIYLSHKAYA